MTFPVAFLPCVLGSAAQLARVAQPVAEASLLSDLGLALIASSALVWLVTHFWKQARDEAAPQSTRTFRSERVSESAPGSAGVAPGADAPQSEARRSSPRVISLYAVTPGQEPYEYNIGDGSTGFALARAA
jgi:hypothetical protein